MGTVTRPTQVYREAETPRPAGLVDTEGSKCVAKMSHKKLKRDGKS